MKHPHSSHNNYSSKKSAKRERNINQVKRATRSAYRMLGVHNSKLTSADKQRLLKQTGVQVLIDFKTDPTLSMANRYESAWKAFDILYQRIQHDIRQVYQKRYQSLSPNAEAFIKQVTVEDHRLTILFFFPVEIVDRISHWIGAGFKAVKQMDGFTVTMERLVDDPRDFPEIIKAAASGCKLYVLEAHRHVSIKQWEGQECQMGFNDQLYDRFSPQ